VSALAHCAGFAHARTLKKRSDGRGWEVSRFLGNITTTTTTTTTATATMTATTSSGEHE